MDIAKRNPQNPIMRPSDLKPGIEGMEIVCLLNPGVFRYNNKIWLLLRVAERPKQIENKISFPIYNKDGKIEILSFDKNDPSLDASDPRVIGYQGKNYLTTLSYLGLYVVKTEFIFMKILRSRLFSDVATWKHSESKTVVSLPWKMASS